MNEDTTARTTDSEGGRVIYVVPQDVLSSRAGDEIGLLDLWAILWRSKRLVVGVTLAFAVLASIYAFAATEWYEASVLLAPADNESTQTIPSQLRAITALGGFAGLNLGGGNDAEAIAVLKSRDFVRAFIKGRNLTSTLLDRGWHSESRSRPDIRDAVKFFREDVMSVSQNVDTKLVTLSIDWTNPLVAADWANSLVERLNSDMRKRALKEASANIAYLQGALAKTDLATLRQSIGTVLEGELQKAMLAQGNKEFAFQIIDRAQVPKYRSRPKRTLIVALAVFLGLLSSVFVVFIRYLIGRHATSNSSVGKPGADGRQLTSE